MMRWLLLADVHANLEALDAVLREADARWGRLPIACAGDIVGYGPNPSECADRLRARDAVCVAGNHDLMVLGKAPRRCTPVGLRAVDWTQTHLQQEAREWIGALPLVRPVPDCFVLCHGSLTNFDEYVVSHEAAHVQLRELSARFPEHRLLICGHTHAPAWLSQGVLKRANPGDVARLAPGEQVLMNPGSAGQSRDRHPLARYAVLDLEAGTLTFAATRYDVRACERKIREAGLTTPLYVKPAALCLGFGQRLIRRAARTILHVGPAQRPAPPPPPMCR